jgi:putative lipoprotein
MIRSTVVVAWALAASLGCQKNEPIGPEGKGDVPSLRTASTAELRVEVFYRERMMLPPTATVEVVLEDGAKMDVAAELIAKETVPTKSGPPYRVTLKYDPSALDPRGRFGVRARIEDQGKLMFTSMEFNPAFGTHGSYDEPPNDPVRVLVRRTAGSAKAPAASITGTRWVFRTLHGEPAGLGAGGRAPDITLQGAEPRVSGFAGCNQITGGYTLEGDQLSFGQMAMTMRACAEGEELERKLAKVLGETRAYEITGSVLRLRDEAGTVIAELAAE